MVAKVTALADNVARDKWRAEGDHGFATGDNLMTVVNQFAFLKKGKRSRSIFDGSLKERHIHNHPNKPLPSHFSNTLGYPSGAPAGTRTSTIHYFERHL